MAGTSGLGAEQRKQNEPDTKYSKDDPHCPLTLDNSKPPQSSKPVVEPPRLVERSKNKKKPTNSFDGKCAVYSVRTFQPNRGAYRDDQGRSINRKKLHRKRIPAISANAHADLAQCGQLRVNPLSTIDAMNIATTPRTIPPTTRTGRTSERSIFYSPNKSLFAV